ncbi:MAG: universal stress protein [Chloroflexi bacterium]|nr:universal stress protein [Chloroflexota bacterium]
MTHATPETHHREAAQPKVSDPHQSAFRRAILALAGGSCDDRIVHLAADLGRASHGELVGVHVVEVGWSMPLDAEVAARSEGAQQILDHAELTAETLKARLEPVLLQARDVGAALVDEATERSADLLVVGLPYRKRFGGEFAIGRTIPYVLKHAPCEVWVVREPIPAEVPQMVAATVDGKELR